MLGDSIAAVISFVVWFCSALFCIAGIFIAGRSLVNSHVGTSLTFRYVGNVIGLLLNCLWMFALVWSWVSSR